MGRPSLNNRRWALEQARMIVHDRAEQRVLLNKMRGKCVRDHWKGTKVKTKSLGVVSDGVLLHVMFT